MDLNFIIPKLSYEILNVPLQAIATSLGLTLDMVEQVAEEQQWKQWFPEDSDIYALELVEDSVNADMLAGEDIFTVKADQFLDKNRKRLQVFNMARELAMAESYANLEVSLISKARDAIASVDTEDVTSLKIVSSVFKDLTKNLQGMNSAISMGQDPSGLPTVVIRDLSGT